MNIDYFTPPSIHINVFSGVLTDTKGESRVIASAPRPEDVELRGDWPRGTDKAKIQQGISAAIAAGLPKEGAK